MNSRPYLLTLAMLMTCILCSANPIYVRFDADTPGANGTLGNPYPTINQALTHAENVQDCIIDIGPGVYEERLSISNRTSSITLRSHYSETTNDYSVIEQTVIKADADTISYTAIELLSNTGEVAFWGLTITGGRTDSLGVGGSGFRMVNNSSVSISHCLIKNNSALSGGGIFALESNVDISKSDIRENYLVPDPNDPVADHLGGGIYHKRGILSINESRVSANDVGNTIPLNSNSWGGGIWYSSDAFPGSYIELNRSEISHNISSVWRAALYLNFNVASAWTLSKIEHCVIYANHSISQSDGAAVSIFTNQTNPNFEGIKNSVIRQNTFGSQYTICNRQVQMGSSDLPYPSLKHCVTHRFLDNGLETEYYGVGNLYVDPRFVDAGNGNFHLAWDEDGPSPCIDAGYPGEFNEFTDPDGTIPDIGPYHYPHYSKKYFDRPGLITWMSFPVLDDRTFVNNEYWNELGYMFYDHMEGPPIDPSQLNQVQWSYNGEDPIMRYIGGSWDQSDQRTIQPKGYKVQFNSGVAIGNVNVNGFKVDANETPAIWVRNFDNWIGYYVPFTQGAGCALSRYLPGSNRFTYLDHIHVIKTQRWGTNRLTAEYDSPWIIDPNTYTFSEGDMAVLLLLNEAPEEMYWNLLSTPREPIEKPLATAFSYEENLDYTSVFIEFDPEDMPSEVGLYVDGQCLGAAVVDSNLIDVCFYAEAAKSGGDLEIMFYYESKGKKTAKGWKLYNQDRMVFEDSALKVDQIGDYAYLSFKRQDGDSPVPLVTALQHNYPNPFNPSTNISFILSGDMHARLEIYNVRGQKVKTLANAPLGKGKHTLEWNGKDENGRPVSSGIYFSRLNTADGGFVNKMMLMK